MAAPIDVSTFKESLIVLTAAGVVIPLVRRFNVSPVIAFLVVGVLVGPYALGSLAGPFPWLGAFVITEPASIATTAELGVALLMFMIGLELSFERLSMMRKMVFGFGGLQLSLCALAVGLVASQFIADVRAAMVIGVALAMSSTAVIIQCLSDAKRLARPTGRATFAVLLFQDLAAVPILVALSVLGAQKGADALGALTLAVLQAAAVVVAMVVLGRLVLRPLFRFVAGANSAESFMAATLLVILAAGVATAASGMSMALGALIAGILLAETEYRRQVETIIDPFKGILLGVFLISVGMSIDLPRIGAAPAMFLAACVALIAGKALIVTVLGRLFGLPLNVALQTGLLLGPGSEFTFVIIGVASYAGLVADGVAAFALTVAATTMVAIPVIERVGRWSGQRLAARTPAPALIAALPDVAEEDPTRVIVCGFGRVGQTVAEMLEAHGASYLAIDADAAAVARHRAAGKPVAFGDAKRIEFLRRCDIAHAKALVVTIDSPAAAAEIVQAARAERSDLIIVVRARDARDAARLYKLGATDAVPETTEASLVLCEQLLVDLGVPMGYVIASVHDQRAKQRADIQAMAPDAVVRRTRLTRSRSKDASA